MLATWDRRAAATRLAQHGGFADQRRAITSLGPALGASSNVERSQLGDDLVSRQRAARAGAPSSLLAGTSR